MMLANVLYLVWPLQLNKKRCWFQHAILSIEHCDFN